MTEKEEPVVAVNDEDHGTIEKTVLFKDADLAMALADESAGLVIDEATNKRLLRKIDLYVCSLMCVIYCIQYMDKVSNSYAAIMGLRTDLDMTGNQYSWVGSSFYLGYLIFECLTSYSLQRFPMAKITGTYIIVWGLVLCLTSTAQNYPSFITARVALGILESAITPAFVLFTSQWFRKEEQFLRTATWVAFNGLGSVVGSLIAYGLAKRDEAGSLPIAGWRLLFVIVGVVTIFMGFVFVVHIPDTPAQAWFLTKEERLQVVERIRSNNQGFGNRHFKWYQVREAFTDIRLYLCFFILMATDIPNGGLSNFGSILISGMGYDTTKALLMTSPQGAVELVGCTLFGFIGMWTKNRMPIAVFGCCVSVLASCLLAFAKNTHAQLAGYYLIGLSPINFIAILSCIASNTAGHTKKVVFNAALLIGYCVGNLVGPQTFKANQAPGYSGAKVAIVICYIAGLVLTCALYYVNWRANRLRDKRGDRLPDDYVNAEFADLTDFENPSFRYAL